MKFLPVLAVFGSFFSAALYAQSVALPPGVSTGTELQSIERTLSGPNLSGVERHDALVRLARLRQLSGDIEGAAKNWIDGATADPDKRDDAALVSGAFCFAAIGEWDRATVILKPLLAQDVEESRTPAQVMIRARYLDACVKVWSAGDSSSLAALADDPEYAALKSAIYYTLWKTTAGKSGEASGVAAETWKARLLAEFPNSPEGRIAATEGGLAESGPAGNSVSARPSPLWMLFPGRDSFNLTPSAPAGTKPAAGSPSVLPAPPPSVPSRVSSPSGAASPKEDSPPNRSGEKLLQTGLFRSEANARAQIEQLKKAGFSASLLHRTVSGVEHWAVIVPAGSSVMGTTRELKSAGFDSFPLN